MTIHSQNRGSFYGITVNEDVAISITLFYLVSDSIVIYFDWKERQFMWVTQRPRQIFRLDTRTSSSSSSQLHTNNSTTTTITPNSITAINITLRPTVMEWVHQVHPGDLQLFRTQELSVVQVSHIQHSSLVLINSFSKTDHPSFPFFFFVCSLSCSNFK